MAKKTFYDVLQVSPSADAEIIKAAYNSLIQRFYPDGSPGDPNDDFLKALNKAFEVLSDPAKRAGYDAALADADEDQSNQADAAHFTKKAAAASEANPHKIPAPADDSAQTSGSDNVDLYEAAIGEKNTTYYLAKFEQFDQQGPGLKVGWNWPAFFSGGTWALYRKMYGWFFAFFGIIFLSNLFEKAGSPLIGAIIFIGPWIAFTIYANSLYHGKVRKKIAAARLTLRDESKLLAYLRQGGGVHTWVIWVFGFVPIIGIVAAIAIPAYQDYQKRAVAQQSQQPASGPWDEFAAKQGGAAPQSSPPASFDPDAYLANTDGASPQKNQQPAVDISAMPPQSQESANPSAQPVEIKTSLGSFTLELYPDKAPKTVENFLKYAKIGFYKGTLFHRVIDNFMIQGGGFDTNLHVKDTFPPIQNEANNGLKNEIYTIAMARTMNPHSATAQFFINVKDNAFLDHTAPTVRGWGYTVFGKVVKGQDVVMKIAKVKTGARDSLPSDVPLEKVVIEDVKLLK